MTRTLAALFAFSIPPAAHAATAPKEIVVAYGDLDLGTASGESELVARLRDAAAKLCGPALPPADSEASVTFHLSVYNACVGRLSERAMAKVKIGRN